MTASLLSGLTPFLAAFIALLCLKQLSLSSRLTSLLLGVSTGLMFAIATLELIPEAISLSEATAQPKAHLHSHHHPQDAIAELSPTPQTDDHHHSSSHAIVQYNLTGCGIAFLLLLILQQLLSTSGHSHSHGGFNKKNEGDLSPNNLPGEEPRSASFRIMTFLALAVHSLIDGLVIAGAYKASEGVGARVALAIILHKIPDGVLLTTLILVSKVGTQKETQEPAEIWDRTTLLTVFVLSVMSPLGSFLTQYFLTTSDFNGFVLSFGAGTFLFITTIEIIPELFKDKSRIVSFLALCGGYLSFFAFEYFVHASEVLVE